MLTETQTYILYNVMAIVCPLLCFFSERKGSKWGILLAYGIILFISATRFDIGDDYVRYTRMFDEVKDKSLETFTVLDILMCEPFVYILGWSFSWSDYTYAYAMACYAFLTLFFYYKTFEYYKVHAFGLFLFVVTWTLFQSWDGVRQNLSIAVFVYSIRFIEQRRFLNYLLFVCFAMMFHYSAIIMLPCYFLSQIKSRPYILVGLVFVFFMLAEVGLMTNIHGKLASVIPYYGQIYGNSIYVQNGEGSYHSTTYILTMFLYMIVIILSRKEHKIYANLLAIGAIIYAIAGGNLNFVRMSWYFTPALMILVPKILQDMKSVTEYNKMFVRYIYIIMLFMALFEGVYLKANFRNVVPYDSIFMENFQYQRFRFRE